MSNNPEIITNAAELRNRFVARVAYYTRNIENAPAPYNNSQFQHYLYMHETNRQALFAVITCYGDATNMSFTQARIALGVSKEILERRL